MGNGIPRPALMGLRWMKYSIEAQVVTGILLSVALLSGLVEDASIGLAFGFVLALFALGLAWGALVRVRILPVFLYVATASLLFHEFLAIIYAFEGVSLRWSFVAMTITGSFFVFMARLQVMEKILDRYGVHL